MGVFVIGKAVCKLEHGKDMDRDEPFLKDTAEFTKLTANSLRLLQSICTKRSR